VQTRERGPPSEPAEFDIIVFIFIITKFSSSVFKILMFNYVFMPKFLFVLRSGNLF
jgi:hypothetical protein